MDHKRKRRVLWKRNPYCCWCGKKTIFAISSPMLPDFATVEHLRPCNHEGTNKIYNLTIACNRCNHLRGKYQHKIRQCRWKIKNYCSSNEFLTIYYKKLHQAKIALALLEKGNNGSN